MYYDAHEVKHCWISATKIMQNVVGFSSWKFGNDSKHTKEASIKTTPLSETKPQSLIHSKPQKLMPIA